MRKLCLLLTVVAVAAASCQKDVVDNNTPMENITIEESVSPYDVSEEEALARLDAELVSIYGEDTRASKRQVRSIRPVKFDEISPATRSNDIDADNLLYIVEFEDNQGSAILGADKRVEDVFAVLDNGVITAEDFENAANGVETDELNTYLAGAIANEAVEQASANPYVEIPDTSELRVSIVERIEVVNYQSNPCLETCWGYGGFYSDECKDSYGDEQRVPALVVAAAQVINKNFDSMFLLLGGESFDMRKIRTLTFNNSNTTVNAQNELARFLAKLSYVLNVDFDSFNPTADEAALTNLLDNSLGYDNIIWCCPTDATFDTNIKYAIYDNDTPLIMKGMYTTNNNSNTWYWVIDGYRKVTYDIYDCIYEGDELISREYMSTYTTRKVHCNFGNTGKYNGFYSFGVIDWNYPRTDDDFCPDYGDVLGNSENICFDSNFGLMVYAL